MRPATLVGKAVARGVERLVGRRNAERLGRNILDYARLDVPNDPATNGERLVQRMVLAHHPRVVVDAGAHFGEWSRYLADQAQNPVEVHLFEPARSSYETLVRDFRPGEYVKPIFNRAGLSSQPGSALLHCPHEAASSSSLHGGLVDITQTETVALTTLDDYCKEQAIRHVDLMKCDAEGHDMFVLEGAHGLLSEQRSGVLQFEYNVRWVLSRVATSAMPSASLLHWATA